MAIVRPLQADDIEYLAPRLRAADVNELDAAWGLDPLAALTLAAEVSETVSVVDRDGAPVAIYGVQADGCIWMTATDEILRMKVEFLRKCREEVEGLQIVYPCLWNFVDARNRVHISWLRWCGFTINPPMAYGRLGLPFHSFYRTASCVSQQ